MVRWMEFLRTELWVRWLSWSLVFALVCLGSYLVVGELPQDRVGEALIYVVCALPLIAAFGIGRRFPSWWWVAGPPLVLGVLFLRWSAGQLWPTPDTDADAQWVAEHAVVFGLVVIVFAIGMCGLGAFGGVVVGKSRKAAQEPASALG